MTRRSAAKISFCVMLILFGVFAVYAQETAAALEIAGEGVSVLRGGAVNWLNLPADALTPIGSGDLIRTDGYGRAFVDYGMMRAYILPDSEFALTEFSTERMHVELTSGRVIFALDSLPALDFRLQVGRMVIEEPSNLFAVQIQDGILWLVSAEGIISGLIDDGPFAAAAEEGVRVGEAVERVELTGGAMSFARIDGLLDGCPATINGRGEASLNVRVGPSTAYDVLGSVPHGLNVFLMATNPDDTRYRIQFLNGFGWILSNAVVHDCENLLELPYSAGERPLRIVRASPDELTLLRPFFGAPEDDLIFYILPQLEG